VIGLIIVLADLHRELSTAVSIRNAVFGSLIIELKLIVIYMLWV